MKKTLAISMGIALAASLASGAQAQDRWPNWYLGLSGNVTWLQDSDVSGPGITNGDMDFGTGWGGNASIGYYPPLSMAPFNSMRFEAEFGYRENDIDTVGNGTTSVNSTGKYSAYSYMANAYYDFHNNSMWTPYLGAGIGIADVRLSTSSGLGNTDSKDRVFAYQGMVGIGYAPVNMAFTEWTLGYRYFATLDPKFNTLTATDVKTEYNSHNIEAGLRMRF